MNKRLTYGFAVLTLLGLIPGLAGASTLPAGSSSGLVHPDYGPGQTFTLYSGDPATDWTYVTELLTTFDSDGVKGSLLATVYETDEGYLAFVYQFTFDSDSILPSNGSITGYGDFDVIDAGLVGTGSYESGDLAVMNRLASLEDVLNFYWRFDSTGELPTAGEATTAFYFVTEATSYSTSALAALITPSGTATVQDIQTLAPIPEPAVMAVLGTGVVIAVIRRRRQRQVR